MIFELIALFCASLFAGAALYVSVVEHPARLRAGPAVALAQFRPSFRRAARMQASLAVLGFLAAVAAYAAGRGMPALLGGLVLIWVIPWTLLVIKPVNRLLLDAERTAETPDTEVLLTRWGMLHTMRTAASLMAVLTLGAHVAGFL